MSIELLEKYFKSIDGFDERNARLFACALHECLSHVHKKPNAQEQFYYLCLTLCQSMFIIYHCMFNNMDNEQAKEEMIKHIWTLFGAKIEH